ncbi:MAG: serine/threonine protein kinase [Polyangiaceae bacterium]|nr:serine/threonine protein kinase [Polyangiaceae bacterium]
MANDPAHGGPPRPSVTGTSPSERERKIAEGSDSLPSGGTYFLGRYRIVDEIGVGGMASVHLARADGPGGFQKWVAIKRIHRHLAEDEQFIRMFLDEARIAARISHPNVAQVFDLGKHRDTYWIAMEYLHGEPLREVMRAVEEAAAPQMGPLLAAKLVADSAEGLHAAHELRDKEGNLLNLVHRDVTPHNLFMTYDGAVKVVDFGIAKVAGRLANTRAGTLKGKLAYMSPEQVRGAAIDRRTDIFALGVVLWELTTGRRLFRMDSDLETLERVQACVVPPPSSIVPDYPVELESIVMRALAKDLERRFQTARDVSRALQQYLMRAGSFVGPEEIGKYVKHVLSDRFQRREAHLQWAAEVTQTISLEQLEGRSGAVDLEEVSLLSFRSDVKEVPRAPKPPASGPKPPAMTQPLPAAGARIPPASPPMSNRAPGAPPPPWPSSPGPAPPQSRPLPSYESTGSADLLEPDDDDEMARTRVTGMGVGMLMAPTPAPAPNARKQTMLGLGAPAPPPPPPNSGLPRFGSSPSASSSPFEMHDYASEDEDAVTTVLSPPSEEEEEHNTISTVHEPPKPYRPAEAMPNDAVVVAPGLLSQETQPPAMYPQHMQPMPGQMIAPGVPYGAAQGYPGTEQPKEGRSSVLVAVIAAATTLIALTLTALVVLKLTEKPQPTQPVAMATQLAPTAPVPLTAAPPATVIPTMTAAPAPTAVAPVVADLPVDPSKLPAEKTAAPKPPPVGTAPRPVATGFKSVPTPATAAAPTPATGNEPGFLTIMCDPACDSVSAGGRNLGPSPVVRRPLPAGNHSVALRKGGTSKSIGVTIRSGETTSRRVTMD